MKKFSISLIVLIFTSVLTAGAFLEYFSARSEYGNVKIEWKTADEINLKEFVIERKTLHGNFISVGSVAPKGDNSFYQFIDENVFKTTDYLFVYRIKIVDNDSKASYSKEVTVTHNISDVKRTWGSIKAMFR